MLHLKTTPASVCHLNEDRDAGLASQGRLGDVFMEGIWMNVEF